MVREEYFQFFSFHNPNMSYPRNSKNHFGRPDAAKASFASLARKAVAEENNCFDKIFIDIGFNNVPSFFERTQINI